MSGPGKQLVSDDSTDEIDENFFGTDSASEDVDTSSDSTDSSNNFENREPFVLEIHDIKKDSTLGPTKLSADTSEGNIKKLKKKKRKSNATSGSTNSTSDAITTRPSNTGTADEEFFDAHESLHSMPENLTNTMDTKNAPMGLDNTQIPKEKSVPGQNPQVVINPDALHASPPPYKQSSFTNPPDAKNPAVIEKASEPANPTARKPSTPGPAAQKGITLTPMNPNQQTGNMQGFDPAAKNPPAPGIQPVLKKPSALTGLKSQDPTQNVTPPPQPDAMKKRVSGLTPMGQSGQPPRMPTDNNLPPDTVKQSNPGLKPQEKDAPK